MNKMIAFVLAAMPIAFAGACIGDQDSDEAAATSSADQDVEKPITGDYNPITKEYYCEVYRPLTWTVGNATCKNSITFPNTTLHVNQTLTIGSNVPPNFGSITFHCDALGNLSITSEYCEVGDNN